MTLETVDTKACLPFLLAGGRGSRLYELTDSECKPAIPFAGQCRIVDFILAATRDAGFTGLIAATQYEPDTLHAHLGSTWAPQFRRGIAVRDGRTLPAPSNQPSSPPDSTMIPTTIEGRTQISGVRSP